MKLNLGCGRNQLEGFVNVDADPKVGPDEEWDLEDALPIETDSVDYIVASHIFEHISSFHELMEECGRVLKVGGKMLVRVPEFPSEASVANPFHVRYFVPQSFLYYTRGGGFGDVLNLRHYWKVEQFLPGKSSPGFKELVVLMVLDEPTEAEEDTDA